MKRPPARVIFGASNLAGTLLVCWGVAGWSVPGAFVAGGALLIGLNFAEALMLRSR